MSVTTATLWVCSNCGHLWLLGERKREELERE